MAGISNSAAPTDPFPNQSPLGPVPPLNGGDSDTETQLTMLSSLFDIIAAPQRTESPRMAIDLEQENQLVLVRLGIAGSLYASLRAKHEPTAQHSLRVALACSAWAEKIGLPGLQRDALEVAALLHDVGKIAVPDNILSKAGALSTLEIEIMDQHWQIGQDILRASCALPEVLDIIANGQSWFDGTKHCHQFVGEQLPVESRMLAIVDAFDAMLTDHVYRRGLTLERAYHELYRQAGTQFDPELVVLFIKLFECDQLNLQQVARRWLQELDPEIVNSQWRRSDRPRWRTGSGAESLFQSKLLDNMSDAVVFIDKTGRIVLWNRGAERLTGITPASVYQKAWAPSLLAISTEHGERIRDEECPFMIAMRSGVQWLRRMAIVGRAGREVTVDAHAVPVVGPDGTPQGLTLILHDVSPELSLEQRCRSLHELATKDPLTQVANRAEFDRVHELFVAAHRESDRPCSLIIADIDRFKRVNDTWGHQAGDAVIQSFARMLQNACRPGDLVARYGGEEFVVLCADCDAVSASRRAEELRFELSELRQPSLDNNPATATFGVTEIQPGDTTITMLRRADRALMTGKQSGRNRVIQLGSGGEPCATAQTTTVAQASADKSGRGPLVQQSMICESPVDRTIEKLRGFIADHHGEIESIDETHVRIRLGEEGLFFRRSSERPLRIVMDLKFSEERAVRPGERQSGTPRTKIDVEITPLKGRDRRQADVLERTRQLLISFRAYLMATDLTPQIEATDEPESNPAGSRRRGLLGWLGF